ncbi:MAG: hypothetical protein FWF83_08865, partial [Clostridiales bacterium]|nr:hypothetical protein [Clostridiales bacterium]
LSDPPGHVFADARSAQVTVQRVEALRELIKQAQASDDFEKNMRDAIQTGGGISATNADRPIPPGQ